MKNLYFILVLIVLAGCSAKKNKVRAVETIAFEESATTSNSNSFTRNLIQKMQASENVKTFKTLYIKANVGYQDDNQSQNVQADIRIKKDETILVSIRFIGITMAKALITREKVQYYEKLSKTHFEGDFSTLSQWLGTDLDFDKLQSLLIGNALFDLSKESFESKSSENETGLFSLNEQMQKVFWVENNNTQLIKQSFEMPMNGQVLQIHYPSFQSHNAMVFPSQVLLEGTHESKKTSISMQYTNMTFDEEFSFPYSVPQGSTLINID